MEEIQPAQAGYLLSSANVSDSGQRKKLQALLRQQLCSTLLAINNGKSCDRLEARLFQALNRLLAGAARGDHIL